MNEDLREAIHEWIKDFNQYDECTDTILRDEMERLMKAEREHKQYEKALMIRGMITLINHEMDYGNGELIPGCIDMTRDADIICEDIIWNYKSARKWNEELRNKIKAWIKEYNKFGNEWLKEYDRYACEDTILYDEMGRLLEMEQDDELYEKALMIQGMIAVIEHTISFGDSAYAPNYKIVGDAKEICNEIIWNYNKKNGGK